MDAANFKVEITTPQKKWNFEDVISCSAPGTKGNFQVLLNHAPLMSELEIGSINIRTKKKTSTFATSGGFLEVKQNIVNLILESCEEANQIDVERAKNAADRARKRLEEKSAEIDLARAQSALARAINRQNVAQKDNPSSQ